MKNTRTDISIKKVATSYFLLVALLLSSFYFIGREIALLTTPNPYETELMVKRKAINRTLNYLYQTDAIGQTLIIGRKNDFPRYQKSLTTALAALDTLKSTATDSVQINRIDSVNTLLRQKSKNVINLLKALHSTQNNEIYEKNLDLIIAQQDSLLQRQHEQYQIMKKQDSLLKKQRPKRFLKRLADAFSGDKDDITVTNNTDSLRKYIPIDSIVTVSQNLRTEIDDSRENLREKVSIQSNRLWRTNQTLNAKIDQIIRDYEQEELSVSLHEIKKQQAIRQQAVYVLGCIAAAAVILALAFLIIIGRDLTRSHRYRKELEEANKKAEELLRSREKLMLTITHDFKAPLSSVIGYSDLLERLIQDERQQFYLQNMKQSSQHLLSLVNNLLDFYRLDSNKAEVQHLSFIPLQLFEEIKNRFIPIATQKGLKLEYKAGDELEKNYIGDPLRITQIANNLLSNAIKFTTQGKISLEVNIQNKILSFSIADTGCGMTHEEQNKIFKEFTRLKSAQGEEGFGLGLSIVQKLVILLQGNIDTESQQGKGSKFSVKIPLQTTNSTIATTSITKDFSDKNLQVLLIDDDRIQLELFTAQLQQKGIVAKACWQANILYKELRENKYDLLFTDVQMPGINGFDLLKYLRNSDISQGHTIPIIAVTARSDINESYFIEKGFAGCLHKPFSLSEMSAIIEKITGITIQNNNDTISPKNENEEPDFSILTAFSSDDIEASKEIIETFINETQKNKDRITTAYSQKNVNEISTVAHKMLPVITMIGIPEMQKILLSLERLKNNTFNEDIDKQTTHLLHLIDNLINNITKYKKQNYC